MVNKTRPKNITVKKAMEKPARAKSTLAVDRQIKIQKALYEIATAASALTDMQEFYAELHRIVGKLMYARNFYVTLYDPASQIISAPYFADEAGDILPAPTRLDKSNRSLRGIVLHTGKTLHVSAKEIEEGRRRGKFTPMGTPAEDWIGVPLKRNGQVIGALTVQSYKKGVRYEEQDVHLLEFVAQHIAVALTRARAIDETRQRNAELQIINSVQQGLVSRLDIRSIYELVGDKIREVFDAQGVTIATYEPATNLLHFPYSIQEGERIDYAPLPLTDKGFRAHVVRTRQPLLLDDVAVQGALYGLVKMPPANAPVTSKSDAPKSWLGVPLLVGNEVRGVVNLYNVDRTHAYGDSEVCLLETIVNSMSVALENAHLFDETQRLLKEAEQRNAELQIINSVQEGLASKLDMPAIYALVGEKIRETFDAQVVTVDTYERAAQILHSRYYFEAGKAQPGTSYAIFGFRRHVIEKRQPLIINSDVTRWMQEYENPVYLGVQPKSAIFIPMLAGEEAIGVISLQNMDRENAFTDPDVRLLTTLANSMSVALENARLFDETQRLLKETEQRAAELAIINSVQQALASKLDMQAIYELVGDKIRGIFDADVVGIGFFNRELGVMTYPYLVDHGERFFPEPAPVSDRHLDYMQATGALLVHTYEQASELMSKWGLKNVGGPMPDNSYIAAPLFISDQFMGRITVAKLPAHAFNESDLRLLQTLANSMSVALENARLFDETQRLLKETEQRAQELATVNAVSAALAGELDLNTLIELVGEQVRSVFKADIAFVALLDKESSIINFPYQYGQKLEPIQLGQGLSSRIIQSGQPLLINQDLDRQRQQMGVTLIGKRAQSFLGVPIFVGGESFGVVSVQSTKQEGLFSENDQRLLGTIAANVGIAFQNARLFNETQRLFQAERQAHEQAETLRSVAQALNRSLSLTEVFNLVLTEIQKVIPYDSAGIYQVHDNRRVFITGRGFGNLKDLVGVSFEFNQREDEIGYLISKSLQPLVLADAAADYPQYFGTGLHAVTKIRSYMAVPIVLNQKLIGMITLDREEPDFYRDQHARLAMAFAAQAATAINNARLFDETQHRNAELAVINSIQAGLASKLDMQAIYDLIGDKIRDIFQAETIAINYFDEKQDLISTPYLWSQNKRLPSEEPIPLSDAPLRKFLIDSRKPWIVNQSSASIPEALDAIPDEHLGHWPRSSMGTPIIASDKVIGIIQIANMEQENAFTDADLRLLETIANSMSIALENARLWEQEKLYRRALERELEIGREIQAGFLPEVLPQVEGWEIAASLLSAREVAGDFYDAFELPDGNIGLVIADVCDKGVGAALFMTLFRSLIRATANLEYFDHTENSNSPPSMAERLKRAMLLTNNYIAETHGESGMFATVFFGILDPHDGKLIYINGGHEPPLIIQAGKVHETLYKTGPAVGAVVNCLFGIHETQLKAGNVLFAFTDGVLDCQNPRGDFYGREKLLNVLRRESDSSDELVRSVESDLRHYIAGATQFDDITLLAVRRG